MTVYFLCDYRGEMKGRLPLVYEMCKLVIDESNVTIIHKCVLKCKMYARKW